MSRKLEAKNFVAGVGVTEDGLFFIRVKENGMAMCTVTLAGDLVITQEALEMAKVELSGAKHGRTVAELKEYLARPRVDRWQP